MQNRDILVEEDGALFLSYFMADFLIDEVCRIKHTPCKSRNELQKKVSLTSKKRRNFIGTVAIALALDSV